MNQKVGHIWVSFWGAFGPHELLVSLMVQRGGRRNWTDNVDLQRSTQGIGLVGLLGFSVFAKGLIRRLDAL